jgi:hypothetical protein
MTDPHGLWKELSHNIAMATTVHGTRPYQMLGWTLFFLSIVVLLFNFIFLGGGSGTAGNSEMQDYGLQQQHHQH